MEELPWESVSTRSTRTRTDRQTLVVHKSDQPLTSKAQPAPTPTNAPKRGQARKPQDGTVVDEGTYAQNEAVAEGFA